MLLSLNSPSIEHACGHTSLRSKEIKENDGFSTQLTALKIQTSSECCFKFGLLALLVKKGSVSLCTVTALCTVGKARSSDHLWCPPFFLKSPEVKS